MGSSSRAYKLCLPMCTCMVLMIALTAGASLEEAEIVQQNATDSMPTDKVFLQYTATDVAGEDTDKPTDPVELQETTRSEKTVHDDEKETENDEWLAFEVRFFRGLTGFVVLTIYTGLFGTGLLRLLGNYSETFRL